MTDAPAVWLDGWLHAWRSSGLGAVALGFWCGGLAVLLLVRWGSRWRRRRRARRRIRVATAAERAASRLLRAYGYEVERVQPRRTFQFLVDGIATHVELRADLLVRRGDERLVADVKTGIVAPRLTHAPTRRQLLEYRIAYGVDGVLLVDMENRKIRRVDFLELAP
ncbi:MAG: hypothetical protein AAF928_08925 [Myxococcota bacterium]